MEIPKSFIAPSHPWPRLPSCYVHTTRVQAHPNPIKVGGPDLWYQMELVDSTVEQSMISSAGGGAGEERVC